MGLVEKGNAAYGSGFDTQFPYQPQSSIGLDVQWVLGVLRRRRKLIITTAAALCAVAAAVAAVTPPEFVATSRIFIDPRGLRIVDRDVTPDTASTDASAAIVESQAQVMVSGRVLETVIRDLNLTADPEFAAASGPLASLKEQVKALFGLEGESSSRDLRALRRLEGAVDARRAPPSYIIDLSVATQSAEKSARIANAIADTYMQMEVAQRADTARNASAALYEQLGELRRDVEVAEDRVESYRSRNGIVDVSGSLVNEQQLEQLNRDLSAARAATLRAEAKYDQIQSILRSGAGIDTLGEALDSPTIASFRNRMAAIELQERALSSQLGDRHPQLIYVRQQKESMRRQLEAELGRIAASARQSLARAREDEVRLERSFDTQKSSALDLKQSMVELRALEREAQAARLVYESNLVRAREISEQQGLNTVSARIISPAVRPAEPRGISLPIILVLAFGVGLGIGCALAMALEVARPANAPRQAQA